MDRLDRREFSALFPALLAGLTAIPGQGQQAAGLPVLQSGVFKPGPLRHGAVPKRASQSYTTGMLQAGNIRLEIHETTQEVGAPHEPIETHLHSEVWLVREGVVELTVNGVPHRMTAGDVGLCVAGDKHYIQNVGDTPASYFVVTVGPPE